MVKNAKNTPKGRSEVPKKPGQYDLKNRSDEVVYTGMTGNLNRRIKEHHNNPKKRFSSVDYRTTPNRDVADKLEDRKLEKNKPRDNKYSK